MKGCKKFYSQHKRALVLTLKPASSALNFIDYYLIGMRIGVKAVDQCFLTFCGFVHPCHLLLHSHSAYSECMAYV